MEELKYGSAEITISRISRLCFWVKVDYSWGPVIRGFQYIQELYQGPWQTSG